MAGVDRAAKTIPDGIETQTEQALVNLAAVLTAVGSSMDDAVKTTIFYAHVEDFGRLNELYARHMPNPPIGAVCPPSAAAPRPARLDQGDRGPANRRSF